MFEYYTPTQAPPAIIILIIIIILFNLAKSKWYHFIRHI